MSDISKNLISYGDGIFDVEECLATAGTQPNDCCLCTTMCYDSTYLKMSGLG